jgi:Na+-driven multidrug efflux pump
MVFLLPSAFLLGRFFGLDALWFSFIIAEFASLSLSLVFFSREYTKKIKPLYEKATTLF